VENVFVIMGPTASGKTKLSIELAKLLNGEIISADSMQIYKYMDIGTAKPDRQEMSGIKHDLIDEIKPDEEFSVARFQELALRYIDMILEEGKIPIIVGGTGLYINSLIYNLSFSETICDWEMRESLKKEAEEKGNKYLHERLRKIDPVAADNIHENNVKRVIRAIEIYEYTKKPITYHKEVSKIVPPNHNFIKIGLTMDRDRLYTRINERVDHMFKKGLIEEVKRLVSLGYDKNLVAMQGLGYKEVFAYFRGELTLNETIELVKKGTRHYAKRQMTWFRKLEDVFWIEADKFENELEMLGNIKCHIDLVAQ